jgi:hypothetical protein
MINPLPLSLSLLSAAAIVVAIDIVVSNIVIVIIVITKDIGDKILHLVVTTFVIHCVVCRVFHHLSLKPIVACFFSRILQHRQAAYLKQDFGNPHQNLLA